MTASIWVLGEALMDCVAQSDGTLRPFMGGSPFNLARAAALRGAPVGYVNPLSTDQFGLHMDQQLEQDGVKPLSAPSALPTSLAVVQIHNGQPSYGFYREGIADRDYTVDAVLRRLQAHPPGVLHTGSLLLVPPEHHKVLDILEGASAQADVPTTHVVDTVGAGDTFWGNCLGDWVITPEGAHLRVAQTLQEAMRAAAINCERAGCQPPRYAEVQAAG